jgi:hypothetical protein
MALTSVLEELKTNGLRGSTQLYLTNIMLNGLPRNQRLTVNSTQVWLTVTGASELLRVNPDYYACLLEEVFTLDVQVLHQVDVDVTRTFAREKWFQDPSSLKSLRNVLLAHCV